MKCSVCGLDAAYEYKLTATSSLFYCDSDLPKFLYARKKAGSLSITLTPVVEEPVVDPEVTEAESPAPKTVKKTAKKSGE
jgi:hypothetical protein